MIYIHNSSGKEYFVHSLNITVIIDVIHHRAVLFTEHSLNTQMIVQKLEEFDKEYTSKEKVKFQEREESRRQEFMKRQEERKVESLILKQQRCDHKWDNTLFDDENGNRCIKKHCRKCLKNKIL